MKDPFLINLRNNLNFRIIALVGIIILAVVTALVFSETTRKLNLSIHNLILGEALILLLGDFSYKGLKNFFTNIYKISESKKIDFTLQPVLWNIFFQMFSYCLGIFLAFSTIPSKLEKEVNQKFDIAISSSFSKIISSYEGGNFITSNYSDITRSINDSSVESHSNNEKFTILFNKNNSSLNPIQELDLYRWISKIDKNDSILVYGFASDERHKQGNHNDRNNTLAKNRASSIFDYVQTREFVNVRSVTTKNDTSLRNDYFNDENDHLSFGNKHELKRIGILQVKENK